MATIATQAKSFGKIEAIAKELLSGTTNIQTQGAIGFLSCDSSLDHAALSACLAAAAPFPIVGVTTLSSVFTHYDANVSASLTVISNPDIHNSCSVSEPLSEPDAPVQMQRLYDSCVAGLKGEAKIFFVFMPIGNNLAVENYLQPLYNLVGAVPLFGGMASDDLGGDKFAVLAQGESYSNRMALVALAGDIDPVWTSTCELTVPSSYSPTVTKAEGTVIYQVDDMPFTEYMRKTGFPTDMHNYSEYPPSIVVYGGTSSIDGTTEVSMLVDVDSATGTGTCGRAIPVGAKINIGYLYPDNIKNTCELALNNLLSLMQSRDSGMEKYSLAFFVSCASRYFTQVGSDTNIEAEIIKAKLPPHIATFGYYGFNEVCPTWAKNGALFNRAHNESLIICAI